MEGNFETAASNFETAPFEDFTEAEAGLTEEAFEKYKGTNWENTVIAISELFGLTTEEAAKEIADKLE